MNRPARSFQPRWAVHLKCFAETRTKKEKEMARILAGGLITIACGLVGACVNSGNQETGAHEDGRPIDNPLTPQDERTNGEGPPRQLISVPEIPGGGENAAPLAAGCGPETAQDCVPPGGGCDNSELLGAGEVEIIDAGSLCFYGEGHDEPSATIEHITEVVEDEEYVHLRIIFDPTFVDTTYGECSLTTGWDQDKGHTLKDLKGSDKVELMLYNCDDELSMHMKVDFIEDESDTECGYATGGVTDGEGDVIVGDETHVLAVGTSLDRNMNGCGYCELEESPCPGGEGYSPSEDAPEWDFRIVYELWVDVEAFGPSGFCRPDIDSVHASPSKAEDNTILVEWDDCPPPPGGDCPPNYELFLSSEGEYLCAGPPDDGDCHEGYQLDLTSEGELCIPEDAQ